jgi:hypothetical protein
MEISEAQSLGFFKKQIFIGEYFGVKNETLWVVMREPGGRETSKLMTNETAKANDAFVELLPSLIIDHSFESDGKKASNENVAKLILDKGMMYINVFTEYLNSLPLVQKKPRE